MKSSKIIMMIVGVILGIAFLTALTSMSYNQVNLITGDETETNVTFSSGEHNLSILDTYSNAVCSDLVAVNSTGEETIEADGNYTFSGSDCTYTVEAESPYVDETVNLSYSYESEPEGYLDNSMSRGLIRIVLGLFALVILAWIISAVVKALGGEY